LAHPLLVPAIAASQFAGPFMVSGVAVALPSLGAELHAGATALSLVETLFLAPRRPPGALYHDHAPCILGSRCGDRRGAAIRAARVR
jgi:hypothetical protein